MYIVKITNNRYFFFFFLSTIKMTVSFKERFKTVLAHQRILFSSSPINFLAHQAQFFRDQPRKKRTKRGVELTDWTRDGHDKSLKYLLGANFRKNNTTVEKARRPFFFFSKMPSTFE